MLEVKKDRETLFSAPVVFASQAAMKSMKKKKEKEKEEKEKKEKKKKLFLLQGIVLGI